MKTKTWAVILILLVALMNAFSQFSLKKASSNLDLSLSILYNPWVYIAAIVLIIGMGIMTLSFKGGDVTALYPLMATNYIWLTLFALYFLKESISIFNWLGIVLIIIGVYLIGGSR